MTSRTRALLVLSGILALAISVYFGWQLYNAHQVKQKTIPLARAATVRIESVLEMNEAKGITWKEAFKKAETLVADLDRTALEIKELAPASPSLVVDATSSYVKTAQSAIRAVEHKLRADFELQMAAEQLKQHNDDLGRTTYSFWKSQEAGVVSRANKAITEGNAAKLHLIAALEAMDRQTLETARHLPSETLVKQAALQKMIGELKAIADVKPIKE
jgi:hypothetical protein